MIVTIRKDSTHFDWVLKVFLLLFKVTLGQVCTSQEIFLLYFTKIVLLLLQHLSCWQVFDEIHRFQELTANADAVVIE